ncbi:MAG: DUF2851 family protein, partial [Dehalococcoidia bacterium]
MSRTRSLDSFAIDSVCGNAATYVVTTTERNNLPTAYFVRSSAFVVNKRYSTWYEYPHRTALPRTVFRESNRRYGKSERPVGPEAILHQAWRNAGLERASVRGRDGHDYRIVYGGRPGGSLGPDFVDAVIERDDGVTFRGDIEIHVRETDWRA